MVRRIVAVASLMVVCLAASSASAATISIRSGDGESWIGSPAIGGGAGTTVVVQPHPAWMPAGTALWVSYDDTGYGGSVLAPPSGTNSIMTVLESFAAASGSILNMKIWADDTARVRINGIEIIAPNFSQGTCAAGPIGCEPHEFGSILNYVFLTGGLHTISFEVFQVGTGTTTHANPFGLLYEGTVETPASVPDPANVPEPAMMVLIGLGLAGAGGRLRRSRRDRSAS